MPSYQYQALDIQGRLTKGMLDAEGEAEARKLLRDMQFEPMRVEPTQAISGFSGLKFGNISRRSIRLSSTELALFTRQLATLVNSGLPLEQSLKLVGRQSRRRHVRNLIGLIREQISAGETLENALLTHPKSFSSLYIASVSAGESTGRLGPVLEQLATHMERQSDHQRALSSALVYPSILIVLAIVIVAALMTFVVPNILGVVISSGQTVPSITTALITVTALFEQFALPLILSIVCCVALWQPALRRFGLEPNWHQLLLATPLVKTHLKAQISARYAATLGLLTSTGIAVTDAMPISARVTDNQYAQEEFRLAAKLVSEGSTLQTALEKTKLLPDFLLQLIGIGEQSGELPSMLNKGAAILEDELQRNAQIFAKALEPVTLVLMGLIVLFIVMGVMLPIINLSSIL